MYKNAFTLLELICVVAILGILLTIMVPNFLNAQIRAKLARTEADMTALTNALEMYYHDHQVYRYSGGCNFNQLTTPISYISSIPQDTFPHKSFEPLEIVKADFITDYYWFPRTWRPPTRYAKGYFILSVGPNMVLDSVSPMGDWVIWRYDTSNGIDSIGDLYRVRLAPNETGFKIFLDPPGPPLWIVLFSSG